MLLWDLLNGKSEQCKSCGGKLSKNSVVLGRRFDAIWQKCNDPLHPNWMTYGVRGTKCNFASRAEFTLWMEEHLPHQDYKGVEIDRENNDGHYEPGNLRLVTRRQNANNRSTTVWVQFAGQRVPRTMFMEQHPECGYGSDTIGDLVRRGMTGEQIIRGTSHNTESVRLRHPERRTSTSIYCVRPDCLKLPGECLALGAR